MYGSDYIHLTTANQTQSLGAGVRLNGVTVNTGAASAILTVYDAGAATAGTEIAIIDASTKGSYQYCGVRGRSGFFVKLTGGNADVTVSYG